MVKDKTGTKVDGGMSCNDLLCQMLADISGCQILRPKLTEATALGAAMVAGYHLGLWDIKDQGQDLTQLTLNNEGLIGKVIRSLSFSNNNDINSNNNNDSNNYDIFWPTLSESSRIDRINTWRMAVSRSRKWIRVEKQELRKVNYKRLSTLPFMFYVLLSFGTHILSAMQ